MGTSKKEINKDYLFNLLMPTAAADLPGIASDLPEPAPVKQAASDRAGLAALGNAVNVRSARELALVNLNERLVADRLDEVFEKFHCCRCDRCRQDVAALALKIRATKKTALSGCFFIPILSLPSPRAIPRRPLSCTPSVYEAASRSH